MRIYFSEYFDVTKESIEEYGAFNISLLNDLPLFVDPFLLFNSDNSMNRELHDDMITYLRFLKEKSDNNELPNALINAWFTFKEVKQNWFGYSEYGNQGRGLGKKFAAALKINLVNVFRNFGNEDITYGSHLERLCLINSGIGRDMISDFTTNLIKKFLLEYTEAFSEKNISNDLLDTFSVEKVYFDYNFEKWMPKNYLLPSFEGDYVLLTPKNILTKDDTWISRDDMVSNIKDIPRAVENAQLRAEINNYLFKILPKDRKPTQKEKSLALTDVIKKYPVLIDYYIKGKEDKGEDAVDLSKSKVLESKLFYVDNISLLARQLEKETEFYSIAGNTKEETLQKIEYFKDLIENKGGHKIFYDAKGKPIMRETDVHIMFRMVWFGTPSDVSREVNDGRGPVDFKISRGAKDKTLVEFKLAKNTQLKANLMKQLEIYQKASDATAGYKVIIYFSDEEYEKVIDILQDLKMDTDENIILIDAGADNKPSGSKAK